MTKEDFQQMAALCTLQAFVTADPGCDYETTAKRAKKHSDELTKLYFPEENDDNDEVPVYDLGL